jgi:hypothetical protein
MGNLDGFANLVAGFFPMMTEPLSLAKMGRVETL